MAFTLNIRHRHETLFRLHLYPEPCQVLCNSQVKCEYDRDYSLGGIKLQRVAVEKDLGVSVSQDLIWNNQVDLISSKAQRMLYLHYHTCKGITDVRT